MQQISEAGHTPCVVLAQIPLPASTNLLGAFSLGQKVSNLAEIRLAEGPSLADLKALRAMYLFEEPAALIFFFVIAWKAALTLAGRSVPLFSCKRDRGGCVDARCRAT